MSEHGVYIQEIYYKKTEDDFSRGRNIQKHYSQMNNKHI